MEKVGISSKLNKHYLDCTHFSTLISRCYREEEVESPLNLPKGTTGKDARSGGVVKMKALVPKNTKRCKRKEMLRERKKTGRNIINEGQSQHFCWV